MNANRKITHEEKKFFFFTGFAIVLSFGAWRQWVNAIPEVEIPTRKMPSPNAYDFYVRAGAAIVKANPAVDPIEDPITVSKAQWKTRYPMAAKEAWLRRNTTALNLLRQGFKYPCRVPPQRSFNFKPPSSYSGLRSMARMLAVESHARAERGHWVGAAASALDILKLGDDVSHGGVVIDFLVGASINAIGRRELWVIMPHLNASESKMIMRRVQEIIATRVQYTDIMREEKYFGQAASLEAMRSGDWYATSSTGAKGWARIKDLWRSYGTPCRVVLKIYTNYMDTLIAAAQKPYAKKTTSPPPPNEVFIHMLVPVFERARWNYARHESGDAFIVTALALQIYRLENNRYPQKLNQLVPRHLKKIPADPFGAGEPIRYKFAGREYSLYSIGPDGIDNHGRAIEDTKYPKEKRRRFLMQPDSNGDFVAGIN